MRCPSCGASYSDEDCCKECGAGLTSDASEATDSNSAGFTSATYPASSPTERKSTLLEFPGVMRSTVPEWRRELSERVREVQERRAREAAQEAAEAERQRVAVTAPAPQLELLPQASAPTINPLVAAALRRIERANQQIPTTASHARTAAAVAYVTEDELERSPDEQAANSAIALDLNQVQVELEPRSPQLEKTHNLVVVPSPLPEFKPAPRRTAKRLISDNDPSLNYLDAIATTYSPCEATERKAGKIRRACAALLDLAVCAMLFAPFAAAIELTNGDWHKPRTIAFAVTTATILAFLYFTMTTAFAGRTIGMRMFSLKTIDARTGLIPTGAQSAGRSVIYLASLFALGVPVVYVLLSREGYTAHDRVSHTIVIRA